MESKNELSKKIEEEKKNIDRLENILNQSKEIVWNLCMNLDDEKKTGFVQSVKRSSLPDTSTILKLQKWNTPTIYNGWEQVTLNPRYGRECFNLEPITDHMPGMGSLVGLAVTVKIKPSVRPQDASQRMKFFEHVASLPSGITKIIVVQDEDKPVIYGSMWGEVSSTFFKSIGVVGTIVDGGVRDLDEMRAVGFHAISRGVCVGHSFGIQFVQWDQPVSVFGVKVQPGQLIHADKHGFLVVPHEDEAKLSDAADFMDLLERKHTMVPGREGTGSPAKDILHDMENANIEFSKEKAAKFGSYEQRFKQ